MIEVGCWMHARRYVYKALESDERMGPALHLIARLYAVEDRAKALALSGEQRLALRKRLSARLLERLHKYLSELKQDVLPKSPAAAAVRYALNQWQALTRWKSTTAPANEPIGTSRWAEATGRSSAAIMAAEQQRF